MPLTILLPVVVLGILGIALLLHLLGLSKRLVIADKNHAAQLWAQHYPGLPAQAVIIADGNHQALVKTKDGPGLIWSMGADATCRLLAEAIVIQETRNGLKLRLGDYTAPTVRVALKQQTDRQRWLAELAGGSHA